MYQRTRNELKAIARELGIEPDGDRRKIETWELAIERAAQSMGISVEAASFPVLRAIELAAKDFQVVPGVDHREKPLGLPFVSTNLSCECPHCGAIRGLYLTTDYLRRHVFRCLYCTYSRFRDFSDSDCVQELERKNFSDIDCVQELIDLSLENIPGVFFDIGTVETVFLESMCQWAPCDELLLPLLAENNCPCGQALASQCDGRTVTLRIYPNRVVRVPCWRTSTACGGRSPPGGDVMA